MVCYASRTAVLLVAACSSALIYSTSKCLRVPSLSILRKHLFMPVLWFVTPLTFLSFQDLWRSRGSAESSYIRKCCSKVFSSYKVDPIQHAPKDHLLSHSFSPAAFLITSTTASGLLILTPWPALQETMSTSIPTSLPASIILRGRSDVMTLSSLHTRYVTGMC